MGLGSHKLLIALLSLFLPTAPSRLGASKYCNEKWVGEVTQHITVGSYLLFCHLMEEWVRTQLKFKQFQKHDWPMKSTASGISSVRQTDRLYGAFSCNRKKLVTSCALRRIYLRNTNSVINKWPERYCTHCVLCSKLHQNCVLSSDIISRRSVCLLFSLK